MVVIQNGVMFGFSNMSVFVCDVIKINVFVLGVGGSLLFCLVNMLVVMGVDMFYLFVDGVYFIMGGYCLIVSNVLQCLFVDNLVY